MADDRLRFCMVTTFYPPYHFGGDGVFVYRLSEALAALGHRVDVVHSIDAYRLQHPSDPEIAFAYHPSVSVHGLRSRLPHLATLAVQQSGRPAFYRPALRRLLDKQHYDVIHYHNVSLMGAPEIFALGRAVKLYTTHEYWLICPTHVLFRMSREPCVRPTCLACTLRHGRPPQLWRYSSMLRRYLRAIDCILTPSRFAMEKHRAAGIDRPMTVLPHFVPPPPEQVASPAPELPERPYFLYAGRLEPAKGPQELIETFRNYRAADLVVVGEGSLDRRLRSRAADLPHVRFLGGVHPERLAALYRHATALLVPTFCYETFGLTAAEAMSCGTPVICRAIGALSEMTGDTGGGLTFATRDELVAAMDRVRSVPSCRAALAERGQDAWRRLWSPEAHLERYLELVRAARSQQAASCLPLRSRGWGGNR